MEQVFIAGFLVGTVGLSFLHAIYAAGYHFGWNKGFDDAEKIWKPK